MKVHQYTMLCASSLSQKAALSPGASETDIAEMVDEYRRRRNYIAAASRKWASNATPAGRLLRLSSVANSAVSKDFALKLLHEERVAVVSGTLSALAAKASSAALTPPAWTKSKKRCPHRPVHKELK